jgi:hypothetical protein
MLYQLSYAACLPAESSTNRRKWLKNAGELAFLVRLSLEPILMGRGREREHSIELLNLIKILTPPRAGWHQFKSRRRAMLVKALQELQAMKTADGHGIGIEILQGLNQRDFMLAAHLVSNEKQQLSIAK